MTDVPKYDLIYTELHDPATGDRYVSGHGVIIVGPDIDRTAVEAAVTHAHGDGWDHLIVEVQHFDYQRRVMWCSRHTGFGCDMEGEWHGHWHAVKHNDAAPDCCHTVALPVWPYQMPTPVTPDGGDQ